MRPSQHSLGGLRFSHRHWGPPSTLAKDHAELPLDGYTLSLTVDRAQSRLRCWLHCCDGRQLTPGLEAQAGLVVYDILEALRKSHHARFRLDLLVADCHSHRTFDFVGDVLLAHKRLLRRGGQRAEGGSPRVPDAASPDPAHAAARRRLSVEQQQQQQQQQQQGAGGGVKPALPAFRFGKPGEEEKEEMGDDGDGAGEEERPILRVLHWASVMTTAPPTAFRPLPRAVLASSSSASAAAVAKADDATAPICWTVQPPIGAFGMSCDWRDIIISPTPSQTRPPLRPPPPRPLL